MLPWRVPEVGKEEEEVEDWGRGRRIVSSFHGYFTLWSSVCGTVGFGMRSLQWV
jgi:hypothetical protein